jgi:hypothetical protein
MSTIDTDDMDLNTAIYAAVAYVVADLDELLPRAAGHRAQGVAEARGARGVPGAQAGGGEAGAPGAGGAAQGAEGASAAADAAAGRSVLQAAAGTGGAFEAYCAGAHFPQVGARRLLHSPALAQPGSCTVRLLHSPACGRRQPPTAF